MATSIAETSTTGVIAGASTGTPSRLLYVGTGTTTTATAPAAATNVKATAGSKSAKVTWTKGGDGGSPLTGQTLYVYSGTSRIAALSFRPRGPASR